MVVAAASATLLCLHFVASILHVGPMNPVQIRAQPLTQAWLLPYFEQTWTLFAPDPIAEDRGMLARFRCDDGTVSGWSDVTTTHIEAVQGSRLFPPRNSRLVSNGSTLPTSSDPVAERLRVRAPRREEDVASHADQAADEADDGAAVPLTSAEVDVRQMGLEFLARYALGEVPDACTEYGDVVAVQLRMVQHLFPPFSQRHRWEETGEVNETDFAWVPLGGAGGPS